MQINICLPVCFVFQFHFNPILHYWIVIFFYVHFQEKDSFTILQIIISVILNVYLSNWVLFYTVVNLKSLYCVFSTIFSCFFLPIDFWCLMTFSPDHLIALSLRIALWITAETFFKLLCHSVNLFEEPKATYLAEQFLVIVFNQFIRSKILFIRIRWRYDKPWSW